MANPGLKSGNEDAAVDGGDGEVYIHLPFHPRILCISLKSFRRSAAKAVIKRTHSCTHTHTSARAHT